MRDFAFYNAGIAEPRGIRRAIVPVRRLLRRILRPILVRQEAIDHQFQDQLDALAQQQRALIEQFQVMTQRLDATEAFGWDYVAMARRLAAIEDRLNALTVEESRATSVGTAFGLDHSGASPRSVPERAA